MEDEPNDDRESSRAGGAMRRGMLRGLVGGAAAMALGGFSGAASAKRRTTKKSRCKRCPKICETRSVVFCRPTPDIATEACVCARNASGGSSCVDIHVGLRCSATNQCLRDADCPADHACIAVDDVHCCPPEAEGQPAPTGNLCVPTCKPAK
ncbi:MAG TPA: hypothetical protein VFU81_18880 [Thermomicrobiales bacterium]|nr:hypothetical protein [Thermomicrobiales bacterium]